MNEAQPLTATLYWGDDPIFTGTPEEARLSVPADVELDPRAFEREGTIDLGSSLSLHLAPTVVAPPIEARDAPDWDYRRATAISWLTHTFLVGAALLTPPGLGLPLDGLHQRTTIFQKTRFEPAERAPRPPSVTDSRGLKGGEGSRIHEGKAAPRSRGPVDPTKVGLLTVLRPGGALSEVLSGGGFGAELDRMLEPIRGPEVAALDPGGAGGLGTRGTGGGGDGRSIGIGGLGGGGPGGPGGDVSLNGRGKKQVRFLPGRTVLGEGLGKAEVGRVMRRHLARFRFCYEKELNADPNLAGKVSVRFTIAPDGRVAQAGIRESTLGSAKVEACLRGVVHTLKFPAPRGGGVVMVSYPFLFSSVD